MFLQFLKRRYAKLSLGGGGELENKKGSFLISSNSTYPAIIYDPFKRIMHMYIVFQTESISKCIEYFLQRKALGIFD